MNRCTAFGEGISPLHPFIYANSTMATAPKITATTLDGPALGAAPTNGTALVGLETMPELEPAATPGTPAAGAGAGAPGAAVCAA